ncbi:hypothetical protein niasHT_013964 [Heterodera trifolii]|uniref:Secreted protein n=1 Tax=Heterodera trifolii TaxID=157864 RepID=A0ABD2KM45_9BILA
MNCAWKPFVTLQNTTSPRVACALLASPMAATAATQPANMLLWTRTPEHTRHSSTLNRCDATSQHVAMDTNTGASEAAEHVEPVNPSDGVNATSQHVAMDTNTGTHEALEHVSRPIHPMAATQPANMLLWTRTPERPRQPSTLSRSIYPMAATQTLLVCLSGHECAWDPFVTLQNTTSPRVPCALIASFHPMAATAADTSQILCQPMATTALS